MSEEEQQAPEPKGPSLAEVLRQDVRPEFVSERKGLSYVTGRYVKQSLNELFGPLGWQYVVVNQYAINDDPAAARWFAHVRLSVSVGDRTVARDGLAIGHGTLEKEIWENRQRTGKFEKVSVGRANEVWDFAAAEAVTDALKRAASSLGQALGLSLYPLTAGEGSKPRPAPKQNTGSTKASGKKSGLKKAGSF